MQMAQRIPELEAAPEPRESPETASDARDGVKSAPGGGAPPLVA